MKFKYIIAALLLGSSLVASAEPQRIADKDEQHAIQMAKRVSHGGLVVSTDKDWFNWDVNILSGCTYYRIEVSHQISPTTMAANWFAPNAPTNG